MLKQANLKNMLPTLGSVVLGATLPLSMAPFDYWLIAPLALSLWFYLLLRDKSSSLSRHSFAFGTGLFAVGASWVYTSIHDFGLSSAPLAAALTAIFVLALAFLFCLPFSLLERLCQVSKQKAPANANNTSYAFALAATYIIGEWSRSWLFTGFPWLYVGYGQINSALAGWAPTGGVFLLGIALCISSAATTLALIHRKEKLAISWLILAATPWFAGWGLGQIQWAKEDGPAIKVAMVQANIPQELKWQPEFLATTIDRYLNLSDGLWEKNDWVIWPEAAIPLPFHRANEIYEEVAKRAEQSNTLFITGSLFRENGRYHNSAIALGQGHGVYHKRKLVPFGEYVPLEEWLRGTISFFNLPTSIIKPGPTEYSSLQSELPTAMKLTPLICYEIVYPELARAKDNEHPVLITLSNDAWFGASIGPLQHMQIAQMRALENQRYLLRATNTGITAVVSPDGKIAKMAPQFSQTSLQAQIHKMSGSTPSALYGSLFALLACFIALLPLAITRWRSNRLL